MPLFNAAEAGTNRSEKVSSTIRGFIRRKEKTFPNAVRQHLKGSIYDTNREPFATVNNRVRFQSYREIIITIAQDMGKDISDEEVLELSNISGLSFRNIPLVVEAYFNSKHT